MSRTGGIMALSIRVLAQGLSGRQVAPAYYQGHDWYYQGNQGDYQEGVIEAGEAEYQPCYRGADGHSQHDHGVVYRHKAGSVLQRSDTGGYNALAGQV